MKLSIIIVSWNVKDLLNNLLESIFKYTTDLDFEIIVVDNDSKDGTAEYLQQKFKNEINKGILRVIANHSNAGFSKGNNQGARQARGEYLLFMNPDMELQENSFEKLLNYLDRNTQVKACTCKLVYPNGELQRSIKRFPTIVDQTIILLKLHHFLKNIHSVKNYLALDFDYEKEQEVEQAMGAFILLKKELYREINGWDEDYWLLWEDVELCKRINQLGEKFKYLPITQIVHHESRSFAQIGSLEKQKKFNRAMLIYFRKHNTAPAYAILLCLQPISLFLAWLTQILKIRPRPQSSIK